MTESSDSQAARSVAHRKSGKWGNMSTVLLPGDAELFLEAEIARAIRRDDRMSRDEYAVARSTYQCFWRLVKYENWHCSWQDPCPFCEEVLR